MIVRLSEIGKRFNKEWIFRHLDYTFESGKSYAITGPNGSGKSTLLKIIAGHQIPSEGEINYSQQEDTIAAEQIFSHLSMVAPYQELIEEFSILEQLHFHKAFKKLNENTSIQDILKACQFEAHRHKLVKELSSGMKQRLQLALAFFFQSDLLLLDEPTSYLDAANTQWYQENIQKILNTGKIIIICSNRPEEYAGFNPTELNVLDFK